MITQGRKRGTIRFAYRPRTDEKKLWLAGSFSDWQPQRMRKQKNGEFVLNMPLAPGEYEYKFLVDGDWAIDADNPRTEPNPFGTFNSILTIDPAGVPV